MDPSYKLQSDTHLHLSNFTTFRSLIGKKNYLKLIRLNISFSILRLCQHILNPLKLHLQVAFWILRYIKIAFAKGLLFKSTSNDTFIGFTDSIWGSPQEISYSTIGFCFYLESSIISWKIKKITYSFKILFQSRVPHLSKQHVWSSLAPISSSWLRIS